MTATCCCTNAAADNSSPAAAALPSAQQPAGTAKHVPYRDSKLTRVLQDSLVRAPCAGGGHAGVMPSAAASGAGGAGRVWRPSQLLPVGSSQRTHSYICQARAIGLGFLPPTLASHTRPPAPSLGSLVATAAARARPPCTPQPRRPRSCCRDQASSRQPAVLLAAGPLAAGWQRPHGHDCVLLTLR